MKKMGDSFRSWVTIVSAFGDFKVKSHVIEFTLKSPKVGTKVHVMITYLPLLALMSMT